ncbi:MAG: rRNA maturation RNase YbeY [Alcaligenaceae bacterium]|nr:rRNA maturation RNase YbeY [Alcaligenaceae bacterium]
MNSNDLFKTDQLNFILQNEAVEHFLNNELSEQHLHQVVLNSLEKVITFYDNDFSAVEITLRIVDTEEAQELNHQYRQKDYATNVLTFEYGIDTTNTLRADIVICAPVVQKEALEQAKIFSDHFTHLLVHGTLHALGFDHDSDDEAQEMEALEIEILAQFQIKNPYL